MAETGLAAVAQGAAAMVTPTVDQLAAARDARAAHSAPNRLAHRAGLYTLYLRIYARTLVEYRADTWVALAAGLLLQAAGFLFLSVVLQRVPRLAGWSFEELVFVYGFASTVGAVSTTFLNAPFDVHSHIRGGSLDVFLLRPVGPLFQVIGLSQQPNSLSVALTGLILMAYSSHELGIVWTAGWLTYLLIALASGAFIMFAVLMLVATLAFWFEVRSLLYPMRWLYDFTRYPLDIFTLPVQALLTFVIPYGLASYYPAAYLLRPAAYAWAAWTVPLSALALTFLAYRFWTFGLRRYVSVGG